jgi:hypothetical protein
MENADPAVKQLADIAYDDKQSAEIRLKATLALIDRAGLSPRTAVDLEVTAKPYQTIFEELDGGSRAAFRGEPEPEPQRELPPADDDGALDVEIVDADEDNWPIPEPWQDDERPADEHTEPQPSPFAPVNPPAPDGLMSYDAAVSAAAAMRRNAVSRRAQRALPPGRS